MVVMSELRLSLLLSTGKSQRKVTPSHRTLLERSLSETNKDQAYSAFVKRVPTLLLADLLHNLQVDK